MADPAITVTDAGNDVVPPGLDWAAAALIGAAGVIHFAMVPAHAGSGLGEPLAFAAAGWFQVVVAALLVSGRGTAPLRSVAAAGNAAIFGVWIWSRASGLPWGAHSGEAESIGLVDGVTAGLEIAAVLILLRLLLGASERRVSLLVPALSSIAAVALATVAVVAPETAEHNHQESGGATAVDPHTAEMARIEATRCDKSLNHPSYFAEAKSMGVDTQQGGNMVMGGGPSGSASGGGDGHSGHDHGGGKASAAPVMTTTTRPDPTGGRGSLALDELIGATAAAAKGEGAAGRLIVALGEADDADYDAWRWWMQANNKVGHAHQAAKPDEGHGGHAGPDVWTAMTDQKQCDQLTEEIDRARSAALRLPTVQDAMDNGYVMVTGYTAGIGAHYMNFRYYDGEFDVDEPEMLLYDGTEPESSVIGLSYYILGSPDAQPTQGFTGPNDHFHRHVGLCMKGVVVIGDSSTTQEECQARGGWKNDAQAGWMNHVWAVPGCESPWGLFSAASPVLDGSLRENSGSDGGACKGSGVRERFNLDAPADTPSGSEEALATPNSADN